MTSQNAISRKVYETSNTLFLYLSAAVSRPQRPSLRPLRGAGPPPPPGAPRPRGRAAPTARPPPDPHSCGPPPDGAQKVATNRKPFLLTFDSIFGKFEGFLRKAEKRVKSESLSRAKTPPIVEDVF
jgi:hypothetical protein